MKKKAILYLLLMPLMALVATSCDKDEEGYYLSSVYSTASYDGDNEVGVTKQPVPGVYSVDQYEKGERRKLLAEKEYYYNNLESMLAAQGIRLNGDGSSANLPKYNRQKRAWETDY